MSIDKWLDDEDTIEEKKREGFYECRKNKRKN